AFPLGVLAVLWRGRLRRLAPPLILMAAFIGWSALSMFWSIEPESTQIRTKTFLQLGLLAWLIWELAPTHERQAHLFQAYVLGAYVAAFDTIGNYLAGAATATGRFAAEGFNPNDLGFTLVLGIPMAWHLATLSRIPVLIWVNRLYVPIAMIAVTLTASRGAFLPALVALLIIPWSLTRQRWSVRAAVVVLLAGSVYAMSS
ncbi:MAG: hypothetical protein GWN71_20065, partial [Gammaproteobacteria bacterium]|nr:hypothetical protein [Gemmatimonadota bacterium]NIU75778.1 hypothetical protein [Gammaproteobacteria bacterium]NIY09712.1 hypothetical protein [Gemmatimonadota bacterium]